MSNSVWPHRWQPTRLPTPPSLGFSRQEHWSGCHFLLQCMKVKSESEVAQSCPTLSDPMDCSLPGFSVHGIFPGKRTGVGCHCLLRYIHVQIFKYIYIYIYAYVHYTCIMICISLIQFPCLICDDISNYSILPPHIPGTKEPGGLPSIGSHRARHDWNDLAAAAPENNIYFTWSTAQQTDLNICWRHSKGSSYIYVYVLYVNIYTYVCNTFFIY